MQVAGGRTSLHAWISDLMEGVNQDILVLKIQHQVEVGGSISGRVAQALPVRRDSTT